MKLPISEPLSSIIANEPHPEFRPFDPRGDLRFYLRNLPHWRQPDVTYFVTFRLADSIPSTVLGQWLDDRNRWYQANGLDPDLKQTNPIQFENNYRKIQVGVRKAFEHRQARILHEELDRCHGSCILKDDGCRKIVADSLKYFHGLRLWLGDAVLMPNHVHTLLVPMGDWQLEDLLGSIKQWCSRKIGIELEAKVETTKIEILDPEKQAAMHGSVDLEFQTTKQTARKTKNHQRWQYESYDRIVRDVEELSIFRNYMFRNPLEASLEEDQYSRHIADWLDTYVLRPECSLNLQVRTP